MKTKVRLPEVFGEPSAHHLLLCLPARQNTIAAPLCVTVASHIMLVERRVRWVSQRKKRGSIEGQQLEQREPVQ